MQSTQYAWSSKLTLHCSFSCNKRLNHFILLKSIAADFFISFISRQNLLPFIIFFFQIVLKNNEQIRPVSSIIKPYEVLLSSWGQKGYRILLWFSIAKIFSVLFSVKINCIEPAVFKNLICDILDFILWNCFFAQFLFDNKARLSKHTLHLGITW